MKKTSRPVLPVLLALALHSAASDQITPGQKFDPDLCPFQQPIDSGAVVDAAGDRAIDANAGAEFLIAVRKWCYPIYYLGAPGTYALEDVYFKRDWQPQGHLMRDVPIPVGVELKPDPSSDGHICIVDTVHRISYDFWACSLTGNERWKRSNYEGRLLLTALSGDKFYLDGSGASPIALSAKGSGFALAPGLIRPGELWGGQIPHALALAISFPARGGPMPPATLSDEEARPYPQALPDGARVRLKPSLWTDALIQGQDWSAVEQTIATALRDYGAFITDSCGDSHQVQLYAENASYYPDPYSGLDGLDVDSWGSAELFHPGFFNSANFEVVDSRPQVPYENVVNTDVDDDQDGIPTVAEIAFGYLDRFESDPSNAQENPDGDALSNRTEWSVFQGWYYPSNPFRADSDLDGVLDAEEIVDGTDPSNPFSVDLAPDFGAEPFPVPESGSAPLQVQWSGVVRGGRPPYSFAWDFGTGGPGSTAQDPQLVYDSTGHFVATLQVADADSRIVRASRTLTVGPAAGLPKIERVARKGKRALKLKIFGRGFAPGCVVHINGMEAPRTRFKSTELVLAKKSQALIELLPEGRSVLITVTNPGGPPSVPVLFVRSGP